MLYVEKMLIKKLASFALYRKSKVQCEQSQSVDKRSGNYNKSCRPQVTFQQIWKGSQHFLLFVIHVASYYIKNETGILLNKIDFGLT